MQRRFYRENVWLFDRVKLLYRAAKLIKSEITDCRGISIRPPIMLWMSSSFVYHRLILSTLCVGAMLWSMAQLRRGQLRMVVYVVGSCWWCGQLSVLARHTHMPHYPPIPTSSWMLCTDRPQFAIYLGSSVFSAQIFSLDVFCRVRYVAGTRVGPDASHSCFHVVAIHASFDRSSGMTLSISWASLL